ncbi:MAG: pantetheine-phosphate adenylyltransferase [Pseudomonadota bacterium]|jgi:pantetheine-phosphate adenylyltransferase|uniref:Phosphopantetheine adenylyltransferase n=1 Tax=anaerobic digester metagenome TaxID=1263854 RepID=A0A485M5Q1_9ZZZZ|nr:pantetheine-phosphate adenylyltransferase [Pseudomonadota bacterium]HON38607.1 pantetheine-phosphate adenylyltransferase [Deltaproteobacteria bacterium]HRS55350.1 pantetheine-phosphate adenylyltransferase [Desulfomonilia bacterium]HPD21741.1 pantetheine-phosphate adenylyltransferase [Deltaproteobacteria bacterium]HPX17438.1 pantetheine-phosphate adenylyltransferase [Deltaproteobacteria bacterium]
MTKRVAVCPGSFDPITNGHLDIVYRGLCVFDKVIIAVGHNPLKKDLFTTEEKLEMIRESVGDDPRIGVDVFEGLLVDYLQTVGACAILRGLRVVSDFEMELQLALMNRRLCSKVETFFLMTDYNNLFVSSTIVKATAAAGGSVEGLVPEPALDKLREKFPKMTT